MEFADVVFSDIVLFFMQKRACFRDVPRRWFAYVRLAKKPPRGLE